MNICVYGASSKAIDKKYIDAVEMLGKEMALRGHALVFGGGASGLMGAAVRGLQKEGGKSVGVAPTFFDKPGVLYRACDEFIFTDTMRQRKQIMEDRSDAFIMTPGGIGTMEEFFEILTLKQLGRHGKPIAVFNVCGYYDELGDMIKKAFKEGFMRDGSENLYKTFDDPCELLDYIENRGDIGRNADISCLSDSNVI